MNEMMRLSAEELGYDLYEMGFRPVPDIDEYGQLRGVRMWRQRPGFLEYITVRPDGLATAGRVVAEFDFRRPFDHGPVLETRRGHVVNTLRWLLSDMDLQRTQPIAVIVPVEVEKARDAALGRRRHTSPWEDPNRLLAGRPWESARDCAGAEPDEEEDDETLFTDEKPNPVADSARHRLTDTARHRLMKLREES
jgi:hypothetical protein